MTESKKLDGEKIESGYIGELQYQIGIDADSGYPCVIFDRQVRWFSLDPNTMIQFARLLVRVAGEAKGQPLTMRVIETDIHMRPEKESP